MKVNISFNKHLLIIALCLVSIPALSQNMPRARQVVDSLCAPHMHGRGYSFNGSQKAASYIRTHFQKARLSPLKHDFFQNFTLQANSFTAAMKVSLNGKPLVVGQDFLAHASSGSGKGTAKIFRLKRSDLENPSQLAQRLPKNWMKYALVYWQEQEPLLANLPPNIMAKLFEMPLHIQLAPKLTHRVGRQQYKKPIIVMREKALPPETKKITFHIKASLGEHIIQNVIGYVPGTSQPDSFIVFTAHYDHLGTMGKKAYFPGANDNASGVAMLLELAYAIAQKPMPYSVAFMAFGAEEAGLVGSRYYTQHPEFPLENIRFLLNIDLMATGEKGTTVVNATEFPNEFAQLQALNTEKGYLSAVKSRGPAANSDHHFFYEKGVPCFFLYLMGNWPHYHDINDKAPIPLTEFEDTYHLFIDFAQQLCKGAE